MRTTGFRSWARPRRYFFSNPFRVFMINLLWPYLREGFGGPPFHGRDSSETHPACSIPGGIDCRFLPAGSEAAFACKIAVKCERRRQFGMKNSHQDTG